MKFFVQSIVFLGLILSASICQAEGNVILDTSADTEENSEAITLQETVSNFIEIGKYFDETYPGIAIEQDFTEDVAQKFPYLTRQEVYDREETIRVLIRLYRYGKETYENIKAKLLLPEEPPLVVAEDEYDIPKERAYIESDDLVVQQDFKKVLSYGGNPRDFEAYEAKYEQERQKKSDGTNFAKMKSMLQKLEWKKLLFYGVIYEDPFIGKQGTGKWIKADNVEMRLIAEDSTINDKQKIRGGVHFYLTGNKFILAQNYQDFQKPKFSFEGSKNLASATYEYPVPLRLTAQDGKTAAVWQGNFMIPLKLEVKDISQPLELKVSADFTLCSRELECKPEHINAELKLEAGEGFYSSVNNFIIQSFIRLPQEKATEFELVKAVVDEMSDGEQVLRLEFDAGESLYNFDVYVENAENMLFSRPRVSVGDSVITARLSPLDKAQKLIGKNFVITARLNDKQFLRKEVTAEKASAFDYRNASLSLAMLFMAALGGFLLNFMPCVFPVLSIKLLSLTRFGATSYQNLRRNFALTIGGIFASFELIALVLSLLKLAGKSIGWGMQFQNPTFLAIMILAIVVFLSVLQNWLGVKTPSWLEDRLKPKKDTDITHFATGALAVLMSTPCTAPYLGTAIGFALGGSASDIWLILNAIALGLSLPYIIVYAYPALADFLPKPGNWMEKLNKLMGLMLFLTLIWLFSILYAQAALWPTVRVGIYAAIFMFLLYYRRLMLDALDETDFEPAIKEKVAGWYNRSIFSILFFVSVITIFDASYSLNKIQEVRTSAKAELIDYEAISAKVKEGKNVVVAIGADWCLTCKYNDTVVFNNAIVENLLKNSNTELVEVDWTSYNEEVLAFMKKFGRQGLPFYVVFSPMVPDGMVLPEILSERSLSSILKSISD